MAEIDFQYTDQTSNKRKSIFVVGIVILGIVVISGLLLLSRQQPTKKVQNVIATARKTDPTLTPTLPAKPTIDKTAVKIQVVNGTGISGQAADVMNTLATAGYSNSNIKLTNAENFDNVITSISMRDNFEEAANDIEKILKATFNETTISSKRIDKYTEFDIVVITGSSVSSELTAETVPNPSSASADVVKTSLQTQ